MWHLLSTVCTVKLCKSLVYLWFYCQWNHQDCMTSIPRHCPSSKSSLQQWFWLFSWSGQLCQKCKKFSCEHINLCLSGKHMHTQKHKHANIYLHTIKPARIWFGYVHMYCIHLNKSTAHINTWARINVGIQCSKVNKHLCKMPKGLI